MTDETEGGWDDQFLSDSRLAQLLEHEARRKARLAQLTDRTAPDPEPEPEPRARRRYRTTENDTA